MKLDLQGRSKIRATKRRVSEKLDAEGVLTGLSEAQRIKLVDHVFFAGLHYDFRARLGPYDRRVDRFFKRGPGQVRRLRAELDKLRAAFKKMREHVTTIEGDDTTASGNFYLAEALNTVRLSDHLEEIARVLPTLQLPADDIFQRIPGHRTSTDDPTLAVTEILFDFFTGECGLGKNDASQRIAQIGNALWGWNIREVDPESATPGRSSAIRKRLKRLSPPRR
jgi:hypothetical protein